MGFSGKILKWDGEIEKTRNYPAYNELYLELTLLFKQRDFGVQIRSKNHGPDVERSWMRSW